MRQVFKGVDGVFLLNPVSQTESHEALLALCGMQLAGVKRLVYLSVFAADQASYLPHFGSKVGVEEAIRHSGLPFTILRPNKFFQNDARLKDAIVQAGIYPQPLGSRGVSRVDVRDIADAAATALSSSGHKGQTYDLNRPDALTGESVAAAWTRVGTRDPLRGRQSRCVGTTVIAVHARLDGVRPQADVRLLSEERIYGVR